MSSASIASDWIPPRFPLLSLNVFPCAVFKVRALVGCFASSLASPAAPRLSGESQLVCRPFGQALSFRFREPSKRYRSTSLSQYINWSYGLFRFISSASRPAMLSGDSSSLPHRNRPKDLIDAFRLQPSLPRKEVIQPHLPIRLPCYDFTPVIGLTFGSWLLAVTSLTSGAPNSHGVTGGVYKARERIHRGMLIRDY